MILLSISQKARACHTHSFKKISYVYTDRDVVKLTKVNGCIVLWLEMEDLMHFKKSANFSKYKRTHDMAFRTIIIGPWKQKRSNIPFHSFNYIFYYFMYDDDLNVKIYQ